MDAREEEAKKLLADADDLAARLKDTEDGKTVAGLLTMLYNADGALARQHALLSLAVPIMKAAERYVAFKLKTAKQIRTPHVAAIEQECANNLCAAISLKNSAFVTPKAPEEKKSLIVNP